MDRACCNTLTAACVDTIIDQDCYSTSWSILGGLMGKFIDLKGEVFGRLKVLEYLGNRRWLCECSCSKHTLINVNGRCLRDSKTKSCGCLHKEMLSQQSKVLFRKHWEPQEIDENTYGIPLSKGQTALINKEDLGVIKDYGWYAHYDKIGKTFYAVTRTHGTRLRMHRLLLNATKEQTVDHTDHNGLNNRRSNIRLCTQSQNCMLCGRIGFNIERAV